MKPEILLEVKDIHKSFANQAIHKGVSFDLRKGEMLGLLGGSGTGKSVLLRSLIGLEYIDAGQVLFRNRRIDGLDENELIPYRINISYAFQSGALFDSVNVFDNISFPLYEHTDLKLEEIQAKVAQVLKLINMDGKEEKMPSELSGGMQKRVGMARSMILDPDIILYDEPTAGLDPANTQNILNIMDALKDKGIAGIFVTHDIPAALKVCDRIAILHDGKIAFEGTPEELMNSEDPLVKNFFINELESSKVEV
jgi:phospholipid/cholesterol/gamma-HCH transport system ATP-binding protein